MATVTIKLHEKDTKSFIMAVVQEGELSLSGIPHDHTLQCVARHKDELSGEQTFFVVHGPRRNMAGFFGKNPHVNICIGVDGRLLKEAEEVEATLLEVGQTVVTYTLEGVRGEFTFPYVKTVPLTW